MASNNVHGLSTRYTRASMGETKRFSIRPGVISLLALVLAGLSAQVWLRNEQIVLWMLERDLTDEGSVDSMLGTVRTSALIIGSLALAASSRMLMAAVLLYSLRAVQSFIADVVRITSPVVRLIWTPATAIYAIVKTASIAVFNHIRTGVMVITSAIDRAIQQIRSGLIVVGERVIAIVSIPVHAARKAFSYVGDKVIVAVDAVGRGIAHASTAIGEAVRSAIGVLVRSFAIFARPVVVAVGLTLVFAAGGVLVAGVRINRAVRFVLGVIVATGASVRNVVTAWVSYVSGVIAATLTSIRTLVLNIVDKASSLAMSLVSVLRSAVATGNNTVAAGAARVTKVFVLAAVAIKFGAVAVTSPAVIAATRTAQFFGEQAERSFTSVWSSVVALVSGVRRIATESVKQLGLLIRQVWASVVAAVVLSANATWTPVAALFRHVALTSKAITGRIWITVSTASRATSDATSSLARGMAGVIGTAIGRVRAVLQTSAAHTGHAVKNRWRGFTKVTGRGVAAFLRVVAAAGIKVEGAMRVALTALTSLVLLPTVWMVRVIWMAFRAIGVLTARTFWSAVAGTWFMWERISGAYVAGESSFVTASNVSGRMVGTPIGYAISIGVKAAHATSAVVMSASLSTVGTVRIVGQVVGIAAGRIASATTVVGERIWAAVSVIATVVGRVVAAVASRTATAFRSVLAMIASGTSTASGYVGTMARAAMSVVATVLAAVLNNVALAGATVLAALTIAWNSARSGTAQVLDFTRTGLAVPAGLITSLGSTVTRTVQSGIVASGHAVNAVLTSMARAFAVTASTTGEGTSLVASGTSSATAAVTRPIKAILGTLGRHITNAGETVLLAIKWLLLNLKTFSTRTSKVVSQGVTFVPRILVIGTGTAPDVVRFGALMVRNQKGVSAMTESNLSQNRLLSLVVTIVIFSLLAAIPIRIFWPEPPEPTVTVAHWATGHLTREGLLKEMAVEFNNAGHRTESGTRIKVEVYDAPSELQGKYVSELIVHGTRRNLHKETNGYMVENVPDPTMVTPSSAHWLVTLNHEVGRDVVDLMDSKSIVSPVIGIVTYTEMARCLGWPEKEIGYQDIIDLRDNPLGWRAYDCADPSWGQKPLLAFTDPRTSSTGRSLHLALYSIAAEKPPESLTREDITDPEVIEYVKKFQGLIDHYQIGTTVLNTKVYQGPQYGHFFVMPEDNLIHLYEGTERAYLNGIKTTAPAIEPGSMVMIYPKEGSMPRRNCACVVNADWVSDEQKEAAGLWTEFIREDEKQRAFMASGFRPGTDLNMNDPLNRAASKITTEFGLNPDTPAPELNPSLTSSQVAADIDANWETVKRSGIVTFVVDTSGSMLGSKIDLAKEGLTGAMSNMASNNRIGLVTFDNTVNVNLPVGPMKDRKWDIAATAKEMKARGETALFDAIELAVIQTDAAEGPENAIRGVVVLTDGRANAGTGRLDSIVEMGTRFETKIRDFDGHDGSVATDGQNSRYEIEDVIGLGDAIGTEHEVQIFFIGIGDDADIQVGRILAESTGAEFVGVAAEDLAQVLEEFSKYF